MKKYTIHLLIALFIIPIFTSRVTGQNFTISGTLKDANTGEGLIGATVRIPELQGVGVTCNEYGFYSLTLKTGTYTLRASYVGYLDFEQQIVLTKDQRLDINLKALHLRTDNIPH